MVRDTHEPLVSRELFEQAQSLRIQAAQKYTKTEKVPFTPNIFRGHIYCAHCGKALHRQKSRSKYIFRCISDDRIGAGACPGDIRVLPEIELFDAILMIIQKEAAVIIGTGCKLKQSSSADVQKAAIEKEISQLRYEAERERKYLISLYEHFVSGVLSKTEYSELKTDYEQKIKVATSRSQQLLEQQKELEVQMANYIELADWLASVGGNMILTSALVERLVERIVVYDQKNISIFFKCRDEIKQMSEV